MAASDDLVPEKGATSIVWKWFGYKRSDLQTKHNILQKSKETVKGVNTRNLFHHLKQKLTVEYIQAMKVREEEILAAGKGSI